MIVGFSKHGTGRASSPIDYLTNTHNPDGTLREVAPAVVRGNPELIRELTDSIEFKRRYTSGVLSFAPGEEITPEMERSIMDRFEEAAFAGLDHDRYAILWVRHQHAGHHELHFLTPRVELATGRSLNISPPGSQSRALFDAFRSMVNAEYGLADPDDPARAQAVSLPNHLARMLKADERTGNVKREDIREVITAHVTEQVLAGAITDRQGVERWLTEQGYSIARSGKDYISLSGASGGRNIRLKGGIYSQERFDAVRASLSEIGPIYDRVDPDKAAEHAETLKRLVDARASFNRRWYPLPEWEAEQRGVEPRAGETPDQFLDRGLGEAAIHPTAEDIAGSPAMRRRERREKAIDAMEEEPEYAKGRLR